MKDTDADFIPGVMILQQEFFSSVLEVLAIFTRESFINLNEGLKMIEGGFGIFSAGV
jgi:hypothetical protein